MTVYKIWNFAVLRRQGFVFCDLSGGNAGGAVCCV